jgi:hypothetical protein
MSVPLHVHVLAMHVPPVPQLLPQPPQFALSVAVFTQLVPQVRFGALHGPVSPCIAASLAGPVSIAGPVSPAGPMSPMALPSARGPESPTAPSRPPPPVSGTFVSVIGFVVVVSFEQPSGAAQSSARPTTSER